MIKNNLYFTLLTNQSIQKSNHTSLLFIEINDKSQIVNKYL